MVGPSAIGSEKGIPISIISTPHASSFFAIKGALEVSRDVVQHIRVPYDVERAAAAIRECDLPVEFAYYLESGGSRLDP